MTIGEITTGHDPISEKHFAKTLFVALVVAVVIVALFSIAIGQKNSLNPLAPAPRTESPAHSTNPSQ